MEINSLVKNGIMNLASVSDIADTNAASSINNQSNADIPMSYMDIAKVNVFIGDMPLETILEGIEKQFDDYINIEDNTNYVDIFYDQMDASYKNINSDKEIFKDELTEALDNIYQIFIDKITELFNTRLTINIVDIESGSVNNVDEIESIIRKLYEFFILEARSNFKIVIANDIKNSLPNTEDHRQYIKTIKSLIDKYTPLITTFGPMEFLKYRGDQEIIELFDSCKVTGNFLRKYTPKLYQNEEFEVELISYISTVQQFRAEVFKNGRE